MTGDMYYVIATVVLFGSGQLYLLWLILKRVTRQPLYDTDTI
jgi:hypothetical protein